ncbi:MAG: hypothetical protein AAF637_02740 [Pseudomonadota bacterium]
MSKPAAPTTLADLEIPEFKFVKFNIDALFTAQKANLAVVQEVQSVMIDAAHAISRIQYEWVSGMLTSGEAALRAKEPAKPEDVVAGLQTSAEKAMGVAKESVDLATAAQQRVTELVTQRAAANLDDLKALAA